VKLFEAGRAWAFALAGLLADARAEACGGCFSRPVEAGKSPQVVTGHRMILAITPEATTLWDQLRYSGNPEDFLWVLPIPAGRTPTLGLGDNAFMDAVEALSLPSIVVQGRQLCPSVPGTGGAPTAGAWQRDVDVGSSGGGGGGCGYGAPRTLDYVPGSRGSGNGPTMATTSSPEVRMFRGSEDFRVDGAGQASVGPYAVHVVRGGPEGTFPAWLSEHGYVLPGEVLGAVRHYTDLGFHFLVLRLRPGAGIRQMQPVRIRIPGASPSLALRMIAAGVADRVDLTLLVFSTGSMRAANFPTEVIYDSELVFDLATRRSNYLELFARRLAAHEHRAWVLESTERIFPGMVPMPPTPPPPPSRSWAQILVGEATPWIAGQVPALAVVPDPRPVDPPLEPQEVAAGAVPVVTFALSSDSYVDRTMLFGEREDPSGTGRPTSLVLSRLRASLPRLGLDRDLTLQDANGLLVPTRRSVERVQNLPPCPTLSRRRRPERSALASVAPVLDGPGLLLGAFVALTLRRTRRAQGGAKGPGPQN
jgi:hypothetical protein